MFRFGGKRGGFSPIGLDLGRRGVRIVQLTRCPHSADQFELFKAFCWDWFVGKDSDVADGGDGASGAVAGISSGSSTAAALRSANGPGELGERIKRVLRQNEFRGREVVVGLSSPEVELRALELPLPNDAQGRTPAMTALRDEPLRQAAQWEIERLMSLPQGEVESDFWLLPASNAVLARRSKAEHPGQPTAIGVVAEKTIVSGVWKMCEAAGVVCRRLDTSLCALSRFGSWLRSLPTAEGLSGEARDLSGSRDEEAAGDIWGLLDLGDYQVRLAICIDEVPVLVRCFDTGGDQWTRRIAESLGLSVAAAEIHLRDHGIQLVTRSGDTQRHAPDTDSTEHQTDKEGRGVRREDQADGGADGSQGGAAPSAHLGGIIRNILREELDSLCGEIERSYRYVLQCYPRHRVSELILVGGAGEMRNLDEYLNEHLGIEVNSAAKRLERTTMRAYGGAGTTFSRTGGGGRYSVSALACALGLAIPPDAMEPLSAGNSRS